MTTIRQIVLTASILGLVFGATLATDSYAAEKNLVENWDFENGVPQPWTTYGTAVLSMGKKADAYKGSEAAYVTVGAKGVNFWDSGVQYHTAETIFSKGITYTWAMFFKAEEPRQINMKAELAVDPWTAYGEQQKDVTVEWKEFFVEFTPGIDVVPASLTLHVAHVPVNFWMDDVRWYEGKYSPAETPKAVGAKGKLATAWGALKAR